jgi:hypothetical protein
MSQEISPKINEGGLAILTHALSTEDNLLLATASGRDDNIRRAGEGTGDYALRLEGKGILSPELCSVIDDFTESSNQSGGLLLKGFEVDTDSEVDPEGARAFGEFILLSTAMHIGKPYGYKSQRDGEIIQNLAPKKEDAEKQLGAGSATMLEWHTEDAHTDLNCNYIALLCMRGAVDAATLISRVDPEELDKTTRAQLEKPEYVIKSDGSYLEESQTKTGVLNYDMAGRLTVRYDPLYTQCQSEEAAGALVELGRYIDDKAVSVVLKQGELLLVDNNVSVHARSPYAPKYDGKDRWLKRVGILNKVVPKEHLYTNNSLVINL